MRNTAPAAYTAVPIGVAVCSGHVPGILPVTFAGLSVTFPESPVTLGRNTQRTGCQWKFLPSEWPKWQRATVHSYFAKWSKPDETGIRVLGRALRKSVGAAPTRLGHCPSRAISW